MNVKHCEDVDGELDALDQHQKERCQEEEMKQYRHHRTHLLNTARYQLHKPVGDCISAPSPNVVDS